MNTRVWENGDSSYLAKNGCWTNVSLDLSFETLTKLALFLWRISWNWEFSVCSQAALVCMTLSQLAGKTSQWLWEMHQDDYGSLDGTKWHGSNKNVFLGLLRLENKLKWHFEMTVLHKFPTKTHAWEDNSIPQEAIEKKLHCVIPVKKGHHPKFTFLNLPDKLLPAD